MSEPVVAQKARYPFEVEAGKNCFWCVCGKSANQLFCDGGHNGTDFAPVKYTAEKEGKAFLCGCKASSKSPL